MNYPKSTRKNAIPGILRELHFDEVYTLEIAFFAIILYNGSMRRRCVSMALPGTPGQRISDLCNGNHITQKELAEKIGVSASQLSRIVSGETRTVSSDILIGVAKEFKVSTDYILGLSTVSVRKSYDISELGLSEGAVRGLVTGAVDVQILNRLLEHRNFPKLIDLIRIYFQDTAAKGITARNQLIEIATASLSDLMKEHPEHRAEAKQDLQLLNAQKMGEHEAEIEKIKNVFLAILRDIKKDIDNGEQPGEAVTAAMFQAMRDALAEQKQNPLSIDDVAAMVAGQIGQLTPMDEETADLFKQLAKKMMKGIDLKSATKLFSVLLASKRPLITELADKLRLKYPLLPTISPCPTMRLEAIRSIIPISCRRYPKSV